MKLLLLILAVFSAPELQAESPVPANGSAVSEMEAYCAVPCTRRSFSGRCISWGRDFCTPYQGTDCVERCTQRSISARCLRYGSDFCGIYPECVLSCDRRSVNGRCISWGADQCVSF